MQRIAPTRNLIAALVVAAGAVVPQDGILAVGTEVPRVVMARRWLSTSMFQVALEARIGGGRLPILRGWLRSPPTRLLGCETGHGPAGVAGRDHAPPIAAYQLLPP